MHDGTSRMSSRIVVLAARGFSLVEMLLAVFILGIGVISIAALFPAGIALQRQATDDLIGPLVAKNAFATLRSKLTQTDFGDFSDFGYSDAYPFNTPYTATPIGGTPIPLPDGDWGWMRPGFVFDDAGTPNVDESAIDIFSSMKTRQALGITSLPVVNLGNHLLDPSELWSALPTALLKGIPYNRVKYPLFSIAFNGGVMGTDYPNRYYEQVAIQPSVTFTQGERAYPQGRANYAAGTATRPQYFWDCMFRRYGGRVQVAVFVYRVSAAGGDSRAYSVAQNNVYNAQAPAFMSLPFEPPLPAKFLAPNIGTATSWPSITATAPRDEIPGTAAIASVPTAAQFGFDKTWDDWQAPGTWLVDNHATIHKVISGRSNPTQGPVKLQRPIARLPQTPVNGVLPNSLPTANNLPSDFISAIWFIPQRDFDAAAAAPAVRFSLTPVYVSVEEL